MHEVVRRQPGRLALLAFWFLAGHFAQGADMFAPRPAMTAQPTAESQRLEAELGVGRWIWTTNFVEKQQCRFWRAFTLPATNLVRKANLRITADNEYRLFFDGREIGQGANWKNLTDYDVTWLLVPGAHVLAVEAFNDALQGGVLLGLRIEYANGEWETIPSDKSWWVVPNDERRWSTRRRPGVRWQPALEVGVIGQLPWWKQPLGISAPSPLRPQEYHFWQSGWFLAGVLTVCAVALALSVRLATRLAVQTRAQKLLERERVRIARDIHDDLGSALTQLVLQGEVAQTEFPPGSAARLQLDQLCERARTVSHSLEEVLWVVNSKRDTLRDFSSYVCKYAQSFLGSTSIRCRLDVESGLPASEFDLPVRRGLFLAVKEALNNAAKYSGASELFLRIHQDAGQLVVVVEDNGRGFDADLLNGEGNGLGNMRQRLAELGGECLIASKPRGGCRVEFRMPLAQAALRNTSWWRCFLPQPTPAKPGTALESRLPTEQDQA